MNKTSFIHVTIDSDIKRKAEEILRKIGISPSTAINMFCKQVVFYNGLPFDTNLPNEEDHNVSFVSTDIEVFLRI